MIGHLSLVCPYAKYLKHCRGRFFKSSILANDKPTCNFSPSAIANAQKREHCAYADLKQFCNILMRPTRTSDVWTPLLAIAATISSDVESFIFRTLIFAMLVGRVT